MVHFVDCMMSPTKCGCAMLVIGDIFSPTAQSWHTVQHRSQNQRDDVHIYGTLEKLPLNAVDPMMGLVHNTYSWRGSARAVQLGEFFLIYGIRGYGSFWNFKFETN